VVRCITTSVNFLCQMFCVLSCSTGHRYHLMHTFLAMEIPTFTMWESSSLTHPSSPDDGATWTHFLHLFVSFVLCIPILVIHRFLVDTDLL